MSRVKAAVVQMNSVDDVGRNLDAATAMVAEAAAGGARLVLLPENFGFMGRRAVDKLAVRESPGQGPMQQRCAELARRHRLWLVAGSIPLHDPAEPRRVLAASLLFDDRGELRARYDKWHLFDVSLGEGRYRESDTIAPGQTPPRACPGPAARGGLSVCYDLRFPELYRRLVADGACWLSVPSAFTRTTGAAHWQPLLAARAIENQCFVLAPNQCRRHADGRGTWGHSMILGPWGEVLAACGEAPGVALAELDFGALAALRRRFPALAHRRLYT